ncbi:hypothetical protein J6590_093991 [Homalodisca vitripennis]|nr:hypothetical protein J6590_093991 [Homalodisca vitripennis]
MLALRGTGLVLIDWFFNVVKEASKPPSYCLGFFDYGNMMERVASNDQKETHGGIRKRMRMSQKITINIPGKIL